jgi:hypothetical protein
MTTVLGGDAVSAKKNALKSEISEVLKLIEDKPKPFLPTFIIEKPKSEQEKNYISERISLILADLDKLKIRVD